MVSNALTCWSSSRSLVAVPVERQICKVIELFGEDVPVELVGSWLVALWSTTDVFIKVQEIAEVVDTRSWRASESGTGETEVVGAGRGSAGLSDRRDWGNR